VVQKARILRFEVKTTVHPFLNQQVNHSDHQNPLLLSSARWLQSTFSYRVSVRWTSLHCTASLCECNRYESNYVSATLRSLYKREHTSINIYIYIETSVRNKCRCSFYCALLTLHCSAPIGGHLQVVCNTKNLKAVTVYVNGSVA
jgi:hypothetical protein